MTYAKHVRCAALGTAALLFAAAAFFPSCRRAKEESAAATSTDARRAATGETAARAAGPTSPSSAPAAVGARKPAKPEVQISVNGLQEGAVLYPGTRALIEIRIRNARAQSAGTKEGTASESERVSQAAAPLVVGTESRSWIDMLKVFCAPIDAKDESKPVEIRVRWIRPKEAPPGRLVLDADREGTASGILEAAEIDRFAAGEYAAFAELRSEEGDPAEAFAGRVRSNPVAVKLAGASDRPSDDDLDLRAYVEASAARLEGREDTARSVIAARLEQNPDSIGMRILNAEILDSQGRVGEALENLRKALDAVKAKAGKPGEIKETPDLLFRRIAGLEKKIAGQKK